MRRGQPFARLFLYVRVSEGLELLLLLWTNEHICSSYPESPASATGPARNPWSLNNRCGTLSGLVLRRAKHLRRRIVSRGVARSAARFGLVRPSALPLRSRPLARRGPASSVAHVQSTLRSLRPWPAWPEQRRGCVGRRRDCRGRLRPIVNRGGRAGRPEPLGRGSSSRCGGGCARGRGRPLRGRGGGPSR
jgi:hypothetical protein